MLTSSLDRKGFLKVVGCKIGKLLQILIGKSQSHGGLLQALGRRQQLLGFFLNRVGHFVEAGHQIAEFVMPRQVAAGRQIPRHQRLCRLYQGINGLCHAF